MYPMKMKPVFKDYLWGGDRLVREYGKDTDVYPVAESWEISCHPDGQSVVGNGEFAGQTLAGVLGRHPRMLGAACARGAPFPILVKLIDAAQGTSLQVHPGDAYARKSEGQAGKNEMWYVLDAEPGTSLTIGCSSPVSRDALKTGIENGTILEIVHTVPVKPGDCFLIPAGMVHAIGEGALLAEIQQNSNITYRMYDYKRRDAAGNLRELHIEKAVEVADTGLKAENRTDTARPRQYDGYSSTPLAPWQWFKTFLLDIQSHAVLISGSNTFSCILAVGGELRLQWGEKQLLLRKGESVFIPAGMGEYTLSGSGKALFTHI